MPGGRGDPRPEPAPGDPRPAAPDGPPFAPWLEPVPSIAHRTAANTRGRGGRHRGGRHRRPPGVGESTPVEATPAVHPAPKPEKPWVSPDPAALEQEAPAWPTLAADPAPEPVPRPGAAVPPGPGLSPPDPTPPWAPPDPR